MPSSLSDWALISYVRAILLRIEQLSLLKIILRLRIVVLIAIPPFAWLSDKVGIIWRIYAHLC